MIYRDAAHCIARIMSIETNTCIAQAAWQKMYEAGFPELRRTGPGLSSSERLAQDAMVRALLHRELIAEQWHAVQAKYSINRHEVAAAVRWLVQRVETPAPLLFRMKAVSAWAIPRALPERFYCIHTWDNEGTPERTLRRWRQLLNRQLNEHVAAAHDAVEMILRAHGLKVLD